ncbi:MAG TPA: site-2 protease family protein [Rectinemataceae bacterium]|nr:site-2 protease family protein [Rectinemataceae bacterium]
MASLDIARVFFSLPGIIVGLVCHEYAHARVATALGDTTPAQEGRLSLNPLRHIDPLGFLLIVVAGFGWAKPVRFSRAGLSRPRTDEMLIAVAGPLTNFALGIIFAVLLKLLLLAGLGSGAGIGELLINTVLYAVFINFGLFVFNLIPIPPLDGSHVLFQSLKISEALEAQLYRYGSAALLGIILIQQYAKIDILHIGTAVNSLAMLALRLLGLVR